MDFELNDILQTLGPNAGLMFAAWIFLQFLQARYVHAYERYQGLVDQYRRQTQDDTRRRSVRAEIFVYRRRCRQMRIATNLGVASAMFLIVSLVAAALTGMLHVESLKYVSAPAAVIGMLLVLAAAAFVFLENNELQGAMDAELNDLPDLREYALRHHEPAFQSRKELSAD